MKKIISLLLALTLLCGAMFTLASCNKDNGNDNTTNNDNNNDKNDNTNTAKKLVVATSPDFPPFEDLVDGKVVGIEVEILELICAELGYEIQFEQIAFDSVIPGVQSGKYDLGMSGISVTPDREKNVCFTAPYCLAAQCIVVKADSTITGKADLTGKKIAVQSGTTAEAFCLENGYTGTSSYEANADAKTALTTGKIDAWVVDDLTAAEMCKGDSSVKILEEHMTTEPYAFAFNFDDEVLCIKFDAVIEKLVEEGKIAQIFAKYDAPYTEPGTAK